MATRNRARTLIQPLLVLIVVAFLIALVAAYTSSQRVWLSNFSKQEVLHAELQVDQVLRAHEEELDSIRTTIEDYSLWTPTAVFASGRDPTYPEDNLTPSVFERSGLSDVLILDSQGTVRFYGEVSHTAISPTSIEPEYLEFVQRLVQDGGLSAPHSSFSEIVNLRAGSRLVIARPIFRNGGTGPRQGLFVVARRLTPATMMRYLRFSSYPLSFLQAAELKPGTVPPRVASWAANAGTSDKTLAVLESESMSAGYLLLRDTNGKPAWMIRVAIAREGYVQTVAAMQRLTLAFAVAIVLFIAVAAALLMRARRLWMDRHASEQRYRAIFEQSGDGVLIVDAESLSVLEMNPALRGRLGYEESDSGGLTLRNIAPDLNLDAADGSAVETRYRGKDGQWRDAEISVSQISANDRPALAVSVHDITRRRAAELQMLEKQQSLDRLAHEDSLTALPNRRQLLKHLSTLVGEATAGAKNFAVLFVDLDRFKTINDSLGHDVGDQFLKAVSTRLRRVVNERDLLVRSGGDEFVVVLHDVASHDQVLARAQRFLDELRAPLEMHGRTLSTSASIGISVAPEHSTNPAELLKFADLAMYEAKTRGRNRCVFFSDDMSAAARERLVLESELRNAIARGEINVHYQPIVDAASRRVSGFEALARWQHRELGSIAPNRFIPIAEDSGLIAPLGTLVMRTVMRDLRAWRNAGLAVVPVAINVSALQLERPGFKDEILTAARAYDIELDALVLELTESAILRVGLQRGTIIEELRTLGLRISVDDFGTGYSSLSYLKNLRIDCLKIDRAFVHDVTAAGENTEIARAILALAAQLKLQVVAEGVETEDQLAGLLRLGCAFAQGYLFGRPVGAAATALLLPPSQESRDESRLGFMPRQDSRVA